MIASLTGIVSYKEPSSVVVEVGGIGYQLAVPVSTLTALPAVNEQVRLHTFQYVREDTLALFGFLTVAEKDLFSQLLGVSGIGPKVALAILSVASVADIKAAIAAGDTAFISSVPGIGKKTAERVVVDLRDKMGPATFETTTTGHADVVEALVGLGYSAKEARQAVQQVSEKETATDQILRIALKELAS